MNELKEKIVQNRRQNDRFYNFMADVTDNDTVIIVGLLLIVAWVAQDIQFLIVGGLLATLKTKGGNK